MAIVKMKKITFVEPLTNEEKKALLELPYYHFTEDEQVGYIENEFLNTLKIDKKYIVTDPEVNKDNPIVKIKESFFDRAFDKFIKKSVHPGYFDIDYSDFLTLCFCVLFGIMFGDIGQGLVLLLIGLLYKKQNTSMFVQLGIFSMFFGVVYGSLFGNEELIPELMELLNINFLHIGLMEIINTRNLLLLATAIGLFMIIICMTINTIDLIKEKQYHVAIFSNKGIAGLILFASILSGTVYSFFNGLKLSTICICLVAVLISNVLLLNYEKENKWHYLWESILSLPSNAMSFVTIGCFALAHAHLMSAVYKISELFGSFGIVIIILGNALVMGIEATEVIHHCSHLVFGTLANFFNNKD